VNTEITDQDRLMAALAWIIAPLAIVILVVEDMKNRPFQRYHAVNSLAFAVIFFVVVSIIAFVTFGCGSVLYILWLVVFYWGYQAYQGIWVEVPYLTNFCRKQGWI
jgi:uncharacterized membrane protein